MYCIYRMNPQTVGLKFLLDEEKALVFSKITVLPVYEGSSPSPLNLVGGDLKLISIKVNGNDLKEGDFNVDSPHPSSHPLPVVHSLWKLLLRYTLKVTHHQRGLYKSSGNFCTQCEAESFRKITFFQGVYTGDCGPDVDHGVAAVGYGATQDGKKYLIVKNSWGPGWGEKGYIRIQRGVATKEGLCGIAMDASYPVKLTSDNPKTTTTAKDEL